MCFFSDLFVVMEVFFLVCLSVSYVTEVAAECVLLVYFVGVLWYCNTLPTVLLVIM